MAQSIENDGGKAHRQLIWKTFWILLGITVLEFVVAFTLPHEFKVLRISIFVIMTIVKAFYIVSEFMHLRYEVKMLIWSILIPLIFVIWLIIALLVEGTAIFNIRIV
jgi:cytochrome c oxidase subunit IV